MISLDKIYEDFLASTKIYTLLESHGVSTKKFSLIDEKLQYILEKAVSEEEITRDEALILSNVSTSQIPFLMAAANYLREKH